MEWEHWLGPPHLHSHSPISGQVSALSALTSWEKLFIKRVRNSDISPARSAILIVPIQAAQCVQTSKCLSRIKTLNGDRKIFIFGIMLFYCFCSCFPNIRCIRSSMSCIHVFERYDASSAQVNVVSSWCFWVSHFFINSVLDYNLLIIDICLPAPIGKNFSSPLSLAVICEYIGRRHSHQVWKS